MTPTVSIHHRGLHYVPIDSSIPPVVAIVLETARRLRTSYDMSMEQVDRTGILPLQLRTSAIWGAIWTEKMR